MFDIVEDSLCNRWKLDFPEWIVEGVATYHKN